MQWPVRKSDPRINRPGSVPLLSRTTGQQPQWLLSAVPGLSDVALTDDWADFYGALPDDLVFECNVEVDHDARGVAVYRNRVVLDQPDQTVPTVVELEQITSWNVTADGDEAVVTVRGDARQRTRLPLGYAGAIKVALREVLGDPSQQ
ncbi:hypothetical protein EDF20_0246 [Frigoribacterium sp. PhB116]|nr:hypothetical protein EDF20_0246 [Frigoribacterium sp. PhB116]